MTTHNNENYNYNSKCKIRLRGPFCLTEPKGNTISVSSKKARALIAILAASPNGESTRANLQAKLWSRGSAKDSLRKELSNLRKLFHSYGLTIFSQSAPRDIVKLNTDCFDIDIQAPAYQQHGEFLEGLDIPSEDNFEDWLREQRAYFNALDKSLEEPGDNANSFGLPALSESLKSPRIQIAVQSVLRLNGTDKDNSRVRQSERILHRIVNLLMHSGGIDLYDQDIDTQVCDVARPIEMYPPHAQLSMEVDDHGNNLSVTVILRSYRSGRIICCRNFTIETSNSENHANDNNKINVFIIETVDEILFALLRSNERSFLEEHFAARLVHIAVENLFKVTPKGLDIARSNLDAAIELDNDAAFYAWRAYIMTHSLDDPRVADFNQLKEEALYYINRAIEIAPYNPLVLSLLTHVYSFGLKQFDKATDLIQKAKSLGSEHVMTHDAEALLKLYTGKLDEAKTPAVHATKLSRFLPFRHCFMTTLCMIDGLKGNYQKAISAGELSLSFQDTDLQNAYPPTVRYLAANYKMVGEFEKAFKLIESLNQRKRFNPNSAVKQTEHIIPNLEIGKFVSG